MEDLLEFLARALVDKPDEMMAKLQHHLGLPVAEHLSEFDLAKTAFAKSTLGDRKILDTKRPHRGSIDTWAKTFSDADLQTLLDALGADFLRSIGYGATVDQLLSRGLRDYGAAGTLAIVYGGGSFQAAFATRYRSPTRTTAVVSWNDGSRSRATTCSPASIADAQASGTSADICPGSVTWTMTTFEPCRRAIPQA